MSIEQIDGCFGEQTRQAIIVYQEDRSLDGDGIVGKNTWRKLLGL
jgi:peptidoglycan hydrolase-like protein with peptidoglycan-binding domain